MTIDVEQVVFIRFNGFQIRTVSEEPVVMLLRQYRDAPVEDSDEEEEVPTTQPDAAPAEPAAVASAGPADETLPADITGMDRNINGMDR